jgi:glutamine synthetase type III
MGECRMYENKTIKDLEKNYFINGVKFTAIEWGMICRLAEKTDAGIVCTGNVERSMGSKGKPAKKYNLKDIVSFKISHN